MKKKLIIIWVGSIHKYVAPPMNLKVLVLFLSPTMFSQRHWIKVSSLAQPRIPSWWESLHYIRIRWFRINIFCTRVVNTHVLNNCILHLIAYVFRASTVIIIYIFVNANCWRYIGQFGLWVSNHMQAHYL